MAPFITRKIVKVHITKSHPADVVQWFGDSKKSFGPSPPYTPVVKKENKIHRNLNCEVKQSWQSACSDLRYRAVVGILVI